MQDPNNPYCGVVAKFMQKAKAGVAPEIHGDGQQTRDFTFIDDAIEATVLAGLSPKAEGEVFNIGTGLETDVNSLARMILDLYHLDLEPLHIDRRDIDNIRRRVVNIEKIRKIIRWVPRYTLKDGLCQTLDWFQRL
jgi:UDP-glucose 4-epimerase